MATFETLFPTAVMLSNLDRNFTDKEQSFFGLCKENTVYNEGNITSNNNYVLDSEELFDLKQALTDAVNEYFQKVINPATDCSLYITQSWINYTKKGQYHHKHSHPNSYLSGVIYLHADKLNDTIYFENAKHNIFNIEAKEWNLFNSKTWYFPVGTGDIVVFPSDLTHFVKTAPCDEERVSLSFNTFIKGTIGANDKLTELRL